MIDVEYQDARPAVLRVVAATDARQSGVKEASGLLRRRADDRKRRGDRNDGREHERAANQA
jgi:hypothetical protein